LGEVERRAGEGTKEEEDRGIIEYENWVGWPMEASRATGQLHKIQIRGSTLAQMGREKAGGDTGCRWGLACDLLARAGPVNLNRVLLPL
jgi:hypothetical protein